VDQSKNASHSSKSRSDAGLIDETKHDELKSQLEEISGGTVAIVAMFISVPPGCLRISASKFLRRQSGIGTSIRSVRRTSRMSLRRG